MNRSASEFGFRIFVLLLHVFLILELMIDLGTPFVETVLMGLFFLIPEFVSVNVMLEVNVCGNLWPL